MLKQSLGGSTSNYLIQGRKAVLTRSWHVRKNFFNKSILALLSCSPFFQHLLLTNEDVWLVNTSVLLTLQFFICKSCGILKVTSVSLVLQMDHRNLKEATVSKKWFTAASYTSASFLLILSSSKSFPLYFEKKLNSSVPDVVFSSS